MTCQASDQPRFEAAWIGSKVLLSFGHGTEQLGHRRVTIAEMRPLPVSVSTVSKV
jgi:hypothetical protein